MTPEQMRQRIAELEEGLNDISHFTPEMAENLANWIDQKSPNDVAQSSLRRLAENLLSAASLLAASPPVSEPTEEIEDLWFTDSKLPIMAMSADCENDRVLRVFFRRPVTREDRANLIEAHNALLREQRAASEPDADVVERVARAMYVARVGTSQNCYEFDELNSAGQYHVFDALIIEAKAAIQALAFPAIKAERDAKDATIRALQEENEGLREALRKIMDPQPFSEHLDPRCCQHTFDDACELFSDIAREALKEQSHD